MAVKFNHADLSVTEKSDDDELQQEKNVGSEQKFRIYDMEEVLKLRTRHKISIARRTLREFVARNKERHTISSPVRL